MMANQATMTGNWNELKGRVRSKWGHMTDDMMEQCKGNMDALVGTIQRVTGETKDKIQEYLNSGAEAGTDLYTKASEAVREGTKQAVEVAQNVGDSVKAGADQAGKYVQAGADQAGKLVQARPIESLMFTFGAGIVAGLALGLVLRAR